MRRLGLLLLPFVVATAAAQEAPQPPQPQPQPAPQPPAPQPPAPQPPPPDAPKVAEFLGADAIRKSDGLVVHYYRSNHVDAKLLAIELDKWKASPRATITADAPAVLPMQAPAGPGQTFQNTLRIEDTEENWPNLKRILEMVDVPQLQVYVEAKIVEITYSSELRLGVQAQVKRNLADTFFQSADIRFPNRIDAVNQFTTAFHEATKYMTFDYIVDLAAAGAHTEITGKPGIFASQGEIARIRVGDSEPIVTQTLSANVVSATTLFKDTGITLEVQPLFVGRDAVRARISAEASRVSDFRVTATSTNLSVVNPVISTRNADTIVTVPDGETLILGGLDLDTRRDEKTGIPFLMDLPVLGYLFGSTTKQREHTELVFFLTFRIWAPGEATVVKPPSEQERIEGAGPTENQ
jgi:type II secretory pathway component GspD/PulD (secretin)